MLSDTYKPFMLSVVKLNVVMLGVMAPVRLDEPKASKYFSFRSTKF
jgi:hypothetical protein